MLGSLPMNLEDQSLKVTFGEQFRGPRLLNVLVLIWTRVHLLDQNAPLSITKHAMLSVEHVRCEQELCVTYPKEIPEKGEGPRQLAYQK